MIVEKTPNYEILITNYYDYHEGFEILSPARKFVNWNTSVGALLLNPNIYFEIDEYGIKLAKFKYSIRIGNIILSGLYFRTPQKRNDVPVLNLYTNIYGTERTDKGYRDLHKKLFDDIGSERYISSFSADFTQAYATFDLDKMTISLVHDYNPDRGYTSLQIENRREYPELLVIEEKVQISKILVLETGIKIYGRYKENEKIRWRPDELQFYCQEVPAIWVDKSNNEIGFSDNTFSQRYFLTKIENIFIQNIYPAKCGGSSRLYITLKADGKRKEIFTATYSTFDKYACEISNLAGLKVIFGEEYPCD